MGIAPGSRSDIRLIINADDFGYFDEVSRGILECVSAGVVTATGVMANGPALPRWANALRSERDCSVGVHLNSTLGVPLTVAMQRELQSIGGAFPGKWHMIAGLLRGKISADMLIDEWRAQIQRCVELGFNLSFLNSHEHMHMLPMLYPRVRELANEFSIPHVRAPATEWGARFSISGAIRSLMFSVNEMMVPPPPVDEPILIGLAPSGHLDLAYCDWRFSRLRPCSTYELMCHPGYIDDCAQSDSKLAAYHDWEGELRTLLHDRFLQTLQRHEVVLCSYVEMQADRIQVPI